MDQEEIEKRFLSMIEKFPKTSLAVLAVKMLTDVVSESKEKTILGIDSELKQAAAIMKAALTTKSTYVGSTIPLMSGCELFLRYISKKLLDPEDFEESKKEFVERGKEITNLSQKSKNNIAQFLAPFIRDNMEILVVGHSRLVINTLEMIKKLSNRRFKVLIPEMRPDCEGVLTASQLAELGIPVTVIVDSAVSHCMQTVEFVLSGAEGVVESGGIINKIGTYQIALSAHFHKKPFYVAAESLKFARMFPIKQEDIEPHLEYSNQPQFTPKYFKNISKKKTTSNEENAPKEEDQVKELEKMDESIKKFITVKNPSSDYTPPTLITLLFTDLGILTPSAISDELIQFYN